MDDFPDETKLCFRVIMMGLGSGTFMVYIVDQHCEIQWTQARKKLAFVYHGWVATWRWIWGTRAGVRVVRRRVNYTEKHGNESTYHAHAVNPSRIYRA